MMTDPNIVSQTINIGPDEDVITINDLYSKISNKLKFNQDPLFEADRPNEVKYATCSSDKARKILNYDTRVSLDESLDKLIEYIKNNGVQKFEYNYKLEITNSKTPNTWLNKLF